MYVALLGLIACNQPEDDDGIYVHALESVALNPDGSVLRSGDLRVVQGRRPRFEGQVGYRLEPYVPVGVYAEFQDDEDDGVLDRVTSVQPGADGGFVRHEDTDGDGFAQNSTWLDASYLPVRFETPRFLRVQNRDALNRVVASEEIQLTGFADASTVENRTYGYEGDAPDFRTYAYSFRGTFDTDLTQRRELNEDGFWIRWLEGPGDTEIARRTVDEAGRTLTRVDTNVDGIETSTVYTRDRWGGVLTLDIERDGVSAHHEVVVRDRRGHWLEWRRDTDGDWSFDHVETQVFDVDAYGRIVYAERSRNGEIVQVYEVTVLGTVDDVDLDPYPVEGVDFGW